MEDLKDYFIDIEHTGSVIYKDKNNKSKWQIPRRLIEQLKEERTQDTLNRFNWIWKAFLKNQYTQQQFSRMFRKIVSSLIPKKEQKESEKK